MKKETNIDRLEVAKNTALLAGEVIINSDHVNAEVHQKTKVHDYATSVDMEVDDLIFNNIKKFFPNDIIASEEKNPDIIKNNFTGWVIDPIDGTNNYKRGVGFSCVSIAYVKNNIPIIGVVRNPYLKQDFTAKKGEGARLNGELIMCGDKKELNENTRLSTVNAYEVGVVQDNISVYLKLPQVWVDVHGSAALEVSFVAANIFDLFFCKGNVKPWDNAASLLIAQEAGCVVRNFKNESVDYLSSEIIVGNEKLVNNFLNHLN